MNPAMETLRYLGTFEIATIKDENDLVSRNATVLFLSPMIFPLCFTVSSLEHKLKKHRQTCLHHQN